MREIIVIQLGNRGANIGSSFWRQISAEHGIENHLLAQQQSVNNQNIDKYHNVFFYEQNEGKVVPRSVVVDLGSSVGDDTPFLEYPDYNNPEGNHIALNNRVYGKLNSEETSQIESAIRKQIERCDGLGYCIFIRDSTEDTSHIISDIELSDIGLGISKTIHDIFIVADRNSSDDQIINTAVSYELFASHYPTRVIYQDSAIQRQVHSKNQRSKIDLNRFVAKTLSNFTYSDRVDNHWGISLSEISHFDPYPGINFTVPSFVTTFDSTSMPCEIDPAPQSILENAIYNSSLLCDADFNVGYYMRAHFFARGFSTQEVTQSITQLKDKKKIKFVSWCPTGFKVGTDNNKNPDLFKLDDKSVCGAFLNSSVVSIFELWNSRIERLTPRAVQSLLARKNIDILEQAKAIKERILDFNEIEQAELAENDVDDEL